MSLEDFRVRRLRAEDYQAGLAEGRRLEREALLRPKSADPHDNESYQLGYKEGYEQGQRDALAKSPATPADTAADP